MVVVQQFLPRDQLEVEFELVLQEGADEDETVTLGCLGEEGADGDLQEERLLSHASELGRNHLHLPLDGVGVAELEVAGEEAVEGFVLGLVLHSNI